MQKISQLEEVVLAVIASGNTGLKGPSLAGAKSIKRYKSRCPVTAQAGEYVYLIDKKQVRLRRPDGGWELYVQLIDRNEQKPPSMALAV